MRRNMYRGKRIDNDEYTFGNLIQSNFSDFIVTMVNTLNDEILTAIVYYKVHPETVGQFSGRCDKNNKRVYENDLVETIRLTRDGKEIRERWVVRLGEYVLPAWINSSPSESDVYQNWGFYLQQVDGNAVSELGGLVIEVVGITNKIGGEDD